MAFSTCASSTNSAPSQPAHHLLIAASAALATIDTIDRKPRPRISPRDSSRLRSSVSRLFQTGPLFTSGAFQMRLSEFCSSAKTEVAPTSSTTVPIAAAQPPSSGRFTRLSRSSTAIAPCVPSRSESCAITSPRAACSPNTSPATLMTISSSGAIENSV